MRLLPLLAAVALLAWLWRRPEPTGKPIDMIRWDDGDEDGVQPPDPVTTWRTRPGPVPAVDLPPWGTYSTSDGSKASYVDPTYDEATALAAIRRAQSSDVTTEGMS